MKGNDVQFVAEVVVVVLVEVTVDPVAAPEAAAEQDIEVLAGQDDEVGVETDPSVEALHLRDAADHTRNTVVVIGNPSYWNFFSLLSLFKSHWFSLDTEERKRNDVVAIVYIRNVVIDLAVARAVKALAGVEAEVL